MTRLFIKQPLASPGSAKDSRGGLQPGLKKPRPETLKDKEIYKKAMQDAVKAKHGI